MSQCIAIQFTCITNNKQLSETGFEKRRLFHEERFITELLLLFVVFGVIHIYRIVFFYKLTEKSVMVILSPIIITGYFQREEESLVVAEELRRRNLKGACSVATVLPEDVSPLIRKAF